MYIHTYSAYISPILRNITVILQYASNIVPVSFEEFLQKKKNYFRETLNYILIKLFSIAGYNFSNSK